MIDGRRAERRQVGLWPVRALIFSAIGLLVLAAVGCGSSEGGSPTRPTVTKPDSSVSLPDVSITAPDISAPDVSITAPDIRLPDVSVALPSTTVPVSTSTAPTSTESLNVQISGSKTDTTVLVAPKDDDQSSKWVWLAAALIVIVLVALIVIDFSRRRARKTAALSWEREASASLDDATTAQSLLVATHASGDAPTGTQLGDADASTRARMTELDSALAQISERLAGAEA